MNKDDIFELREGLRGVTVGGGEWATFAEGTPMKVTKVHSDGSVWVRGERSEYSYWQTPVVTVRINAEDVARYLALPDPNAPKPRKLGETPEGDFIATDDPRIAWIWEDAAKVANQANLCSTYDSLCDKLSIPGREREFTVKRTVAGFEISRKFKARSKKLAEAAFDAELSGLGVSA